jgi:hypothetical protein
VATSPKLPEGWAKAKLQKREHRKASIRAKGEHPFRVIKRQFNDRSWSIVPIAAGAEIINLCDANVDLGNSIAMPTVVRSTPHCASRHLGTFTHDASRR